MKAESLDGIRLQFDGKKLVSFYIIVNLTGFFFRKVTLFVMKSSNSSKLLFDEKFESIRSFLERSTMSVIVSYDSIVCIFCNQFRALKKLGLRNAFLDPDPRNCWHKKHQKNAVHSLLCQRDRFFDTNCILAKSSKNRTKINSRIICARPSETIITL